MNDPPSSNNRTHTPRASIPKKRGGNGEWRDVDHGWGQLDRSFMPDEEPDLPTPQLTEEMVPAVILECAGELADWKNCPVDYAVAGMLGAAAGLIGSARVIVTPSAWEEPSILWMMVVGPSGAKKSPASDFFKETVDRLQTEMQQTWGTENEDGDDRDAPRLLFSSATIEALMAVLAKNPSGLWGAFDELSAWFKGFGQYKGGKGSDKNDWMSLYGGGLGSTDRKREGHTRVPWAGTSITGNIVPDAALDVIGESDGDGMAERFVYFYPKKRPAKKLEEINPRMVVGLKGWVRRAFRKLSSLRKKRTATAVGTHIYLEPDPSKIKLTEAAWRRFQDIELGYQERQPESKFIDGWVSKGAGRILRLSLVFKYLEWALTGGNEPGLIDADTIERAAKFIRDYAEPMARKVARGLAFSSDEKLAVRVIDHIVKRELKVVNSSDIGRSHVKALRNSGVADRVFALLQQKNCVRPVVTTAMGRPRNDWEVNPGVFE